jgi:hypothetical protein
MMASGRETFFIVFQARLTPAFAPLLWKKSWTSTYAVSTATSSRARVWYSGLDSSILWF